MLPLEGPALLIRFYKCLCDSSARTDLNPVEYVHLHPGSSGLLHIFAMHISFPSIPIQQSTRICLSATLQAKHTPESEDTSESLAVCLVTKYLVCVVVNLLGT